MSKEKDGWGFLHKQIWMNWLMWIHLWSQSSHTFTFVMGVMLASLTGQSVCVDNLFQTDLSQFLSNRSDQTYEVQWLFLIRLLTFFCFGLLLHKRTQQISNLPAETSLNSCQTPKWPLLHEKESTFTQLIFFYYYFLLYFFKKPKCIRDSIKTRKIATKWGKISVVIKC